jgi:uncharacterized C2H2 Zn-finger protein
MNEEVVIVERDGWRWINRCPRCEANALMEDDHQWSCDNGHLFDMPNEEIVSRPTPGR